jgi:hypothetical protein
MIHPLCIILVHPLYAVRCNFELVLGYGISCVMIKE